MWRMVVWKHFLMRRIAVMVQYKRGGKIYRKTERWWAWTKKEGNKKERKSGSGGGSLGVFRVFLKRYEIDGGN